MVYKKYIVIILMLLVIMPVTFAEIDFTDEEEAWIESHRDQVLTLGLDPYSGMDYYSYNGDQHGYIIDVVSILESSTGLDIDIVGDQSWGVVYSGLVNGEIDILFGANETPERLEFMSFTEPIHAYPYAIFSNADSDIVTIGDLDKKKIGFIEGDIIIDLFVELYSSFDSEIVLYADQTDGLKGLENKEISGFITSGGGIVHDFLYNYENINFIVELEDLTSDMTLSTRHENAILTDIISKVIEAKKLQIDTAIYKSEIIYNRKILQLTDEENKWLDTDGSAVVGVVSDYLPFDHYEDGSYKGITREVLNQIEDILGVEFTYYYGTFEEVYQEALLGNVEILNMAKTDERLNHFIFPRAFGKERDVIYGLKGASHVEDIYGLEDKKIAVIEGFWHEEYIVKNLRNYEIIKTESIKESIRLVNNGKADYFIENPTVAEFYISGLSYNNIRKKGETSADSFLYFGVTNYNPELASLIDKALTLVDYNAAKQVGIDSVPQLISRGALLLIGVIFTLLILLGIIVFLLFRSFKSLIQEKESSAALKAKEHQMYLDPLTGLNNRLYFNLVEDLVMDKGYPQAVIITDLNRLKPINDKLGHHMGDAYIKAFGDILKSYHDGIICRMGGDEFLLLVTETDVEHVEQLIDDIKEAMRVAEIHGDEQTISGISAAFGYTMRYDSSEYLNDIVILADHAMYEDKTKE